eukprot:TRINITY_DN59201_c0_g1_i1.p1 TRINITY_DN59201_c0_g1~~TRINITY_DN59201_c0_g1_i1.p1  ORF type:complete len:120 (+),score=5.47 TRINITY_DN59201_c0_g1_i1:80-439(+)
MFISLYSFFFFLMIRRPPRSTLSSSSAASDVYKRQVEILLHYSTPKINGGRTVLVVEGVTDKTIDLCPCPGVEPGGMVAHRYDTFVTRPNGGPWLKGPSHIGQLREGLFGIGALKGRVE